jgi:hypothetical protein
LTISSAQHLHFARRVRYDVTVSAWTRTSEWHDVVDDDGCPSSSAVVLLCTRAQIEHFFVSYNDMNGKRFEVKGGPKKRALTLVTAAMKKRTGR